jgi:NAD-dependent dihydropyrimidine dehydrogenase PreA subunit
VPDPDMRINQRKCVGCKICIPYCTVGAIKYTAQKTCEIGEDECVECYVCYTSGICPRRAFEKSHLKWPRTIRHAFSCPTTGHEETLIVGRGTEEMKTNDVTGRYGFGEVGFTIDVGRPGVGTTLMDVEKIAMTVAKVGVRFEPNNPITALMTDKKTGKLRHDVLMERTLSCIIEFKTEENKTVPTVNALKEVSKHISTVFSVGCIGKAMPDGTVPIKSLLDKADVSYRPNGKTNIGLGRPKHKF